MSNQQTQPRVRRITSPSLKTGPMRATHPFGWRQGSSPTTVSSRSTSGRKNSPSSSPTPIGRTQVASETLRKNPRSPDHRTSPDRASSPFINIKDSLAGLTYHLLRSDHRQAVHIIHQRTHPGSRN